MCCCNDREKAGDRLQERATVIGRAGGLFTYLFGFDHAAGEAKRRRNRTSLLILLSPLTNNFVLSAAFHRRGLATVVTDDMMSSIRLEPSAVDGGCEDMMDDVTATTRG